MQVIKWLLQLVTIVHRKIYFSLNDADMTFTFVQLAKNAGATTSAETPIARLPAAAPSITLATATVNWMMTPMTTLTTTTTTLTATMITVMILSNIQVSYSLHCCLYWCLIGPI